MGIMVRYTMWTRPEEAFHVQQCQRRLRVTSNSVNNTALQAVLHVLTQGLRAGAGHR